MTILLFSVYLAKVALLSGILYAYYHVALRDKQAFGWNRAYLLAATALSVGAPLLNFRLPVRVPGAETPMLVHLLRVVPGVGEVTSDGGATLVMRRIDFRWDALGFWAMASWQPPCWASLPSTSGARPLKAERHGDAAGRGHADSDRCAGYALLFFSLDILGQEPAGGVRKRSGHFPPRVGPRT